MKFSTQHLPCAILLLFLFNLPLWCQSANVGEKCNLGVFGFKESKSFFAFDRDLRDAIAKRDIGRLAALVQFPLRVTDDRGMVFVHDARSLQGRFEDIFTPAIRKAILSSTPDTIWCNYTGISYGEGQIWVNVTDNGYFVMTINLPEKHHNHTPSATAVEMACHTDQKRIVIDQQSDGSPRFRSWGYKQSVSQSPDLEIKAGQQEFEGTGPCAHRIWTFQTNKINVRVEEPGCYGDDAPPANAQAQIFLSDAADASRTPGKEQSEWCF
jgi:hypothetical protein